MSSASERMSKVELGAVQNSLHPDKESSLQKMEEIILEKKNDYGKKLILKLTKVKDFELDNKYVNYFLLLINCQCLGCNVWGISLVFLGWHLQSADPDRSTLLQRLGLLIGFQRSSKWTSYLPILF